MCISIMSMLFKYYRAGPDFGTLRMLYPSSVFLFNNSTFQTRMVSKQLPPSCPGQFHLSLSLLFDYFFLSYSLLSSSRNSLHNCQSFKRSVFISHLFISNFWAEQPPIMSRSVLSVLVKDTDYICFTSIIGSRVEDH